MSPTQLQQMKKTQHGRCGAQTNKTIKSWN